MSTYYKGLRNGVSPFWRFQWPLPKKGKPGEWVQIEGDPLVGYRGFHAYRSARDVEYHLDVWEIEVDDDAGFSGNIDMVAAKRARLVRLVRKGGDRRLGRILIRGVLPCTKCGEVHHGREVIGSRLAPQWGSPIDGHPYYAVDAEQALRALLESGAVTVEQVKAVA